MAIELADAWLAAPPPAAAPSAPLSDAEVEALGVLEPWDASTYYVVRHVALDGEDAALRQRLFALHKALSLVALLSGDTVAGDPVRALFLDAWSGCARSLRRVIPLLVDAGDVLAALGRSARTAGLHGRPAAARALSQARQPITRPRLERRCGA